jgi:ABC-2 type transport system permease protein
MKRVGYIATREFLGTVMTRGFVIGVLLMPAMIALAFALGPRLMSQRPPHVRGQIAVVDATGAVLPELRQAIAPRSITGRREEAARRALAAAPRPVRDIADGSGATSPTVIERVVGAPPEIEVVDAPGGAGDPSLKQAKSWLTDATAADLRLALIVIHPDAANLAPGRDEYGTYDLYVPQNLDDRIEAVIVESLRDAIVAARARAHQIDPRNLDAMARVTRAGSVTVTKDNERVTVGVFNRVLPFAFVGLLLISVLMGGQGLMTSTVEEKTSRVIEVLLSAVSPFELLAGKILGQMCVSLVILGIYIGLSFVMLASFALLGLLDLSLVFYLFVFFVITYITIGSAMAAVGSAVNELREAQALMMPIMLVLMVPWVLAAPIAREPNSLFSTTMSFLPPVNTFAMLLRLTSAAPPPIWQVWLTIGIGLAAVVVSVWCAAKVFTIGLLMYGKPPDIKTLLRWIRES